MMRCLQSELEAKKTEVQNTEDALAAVEEFGITAEDTDVLRLSIGESFVQVTAEVAEERLQGPSIVLSIICMRQFTIHHKFRFDCQQLCFGTKII